MFACICKEGKGTEGLCPCCHCPVEHLCWGVRWCCWLQACLHSGAGATVAWCWVVQSCQHGTKNNDSWNKRHFPHKDGVWFFRHIPSGSCGRPTVYWGTLTALKLLCGSKVIFKKHYCRNESDTFMPCPFWSIVLPSAACVNQGFWRFSSLVCLSPLMFPLFYFSVCDRSPPEYQYNTTNFWDWQTFEDEAKFPGEIE